MLLPVFFQNVHLKPGGLLEGYGEPQFPELQRDMPAWALLSPDSTLHQGATVPVVN